jgi:7-cyano-7-deazaguanine synthase in queuosine biosynthesis
MNSRHEVPQVVLLGGGIESTLLVKQLLAAGAAVIPVHVRCGLLWEECEARYIRRFCRANACPLLAPLLEIDRPCAELLGGHWGLTRTGIPRAGEPASRLEIPERNWTLLCTVAPRFARWPELHLVMGTTADNSYSDGTRAFFDGCERTLSEQLGRPVRIRTPLIRDDKSAVIRQADRETLALSFSCIDPQGELHCGRCYKCGRRRAAFRKAGVEDPTVYAGPPDS